MKDFFFPSTMVAKYIPCYHCGNKYEDVDIAPGLFSVEEKVVDLGVGLYCRQELGFCSAQAVVR